MHAGARTPPPSSRRSPATIATPFDIIAAATVVIAGRVARFPTGAITHRRDRRASPRSRELEGTSIATWSSPAPGRPASPPPWRWRRGFRPSGSSASTRRAFPRDKPCGGGLTGHAHAALARLGLEVRVPRVPCGRGRLAYRRPRARCGAGAAGRHRPPVRVRRRSRGAGARARDRDR